MKYIEILKQKIIDNPKGWYKWLTGQKEIVAEINQTVNFDLSLKEKTYWYINGLTSFPKCKVCGKDVTSFKNMERGYLEHCSCSCAQLDADTRAKLAKTCLSKYGTVNPAQSKVVHDKMESTCEKRYGTKNVFASEYGKEKIKQVMKERYGVENCQQCKAIKEKTQKTVLERYGVTCSYHVKGNFHTSKGELELFEFVKQHFSDAKHGDRQQVWPLELDVFIPSLSAALEYDGDYWHSLPDMIERDKVKNEMCKEKNLTLIRVKESDWTKNNMNEKNRILEILNGCKLS